MVVEPAAGDDGDAVEAGDARLREQAREHVPDDAPDRVRREDVQAVVVPEVELELRREVAHRARHEPEEHRCGRAYEA